MKVKSLVLFRALAVIFLVAVMLGAPARAEELVKGTNVTSVTFVGQDRVRGSYVQVDAVNWQRVRQNGSVGARYRESRRDEWSVYLTGNSTPDVVLNLWTKNVMSDGKTLAKVVGATATPVTQAPAVVQGDSGTAASGGLTDQAQETVKGLNVTSVTFGSGSRVRGSYVQVDGVNWQRVRNNGFAGARYRESRRDEWSVHLTGISTPDVVLNLWTKNVMSDGKTLAKVMGASAATVKPGPVATTPVEQGPVKITGNNVAAVKTASGEVITEIRDGIWDVERAEFRELRRDAGSVYLRDDSTDSEIQLDLAGMQLVTTSAPWLEGAISEAFATRIELPPLTVHVPTAPRPECPPLLSVEKSQQYIGKGNTVCRAGRLNEGNPKDPKNKQHFLVARKSSLASCQTACDAQSGCYGVEFIKADARCELWRVPIKAILRDNRGYACYVKASKLAVGGPDLEAYAGVYYRELSEDTRDHNPRRATISVSQNKLTWNHGPGGKLWSLTKTADRNRLAVGTDYPYKDNACAGPNQAQGPQVTWNGEEVATIIDEFGHVWRQSWQWAKEANSKKLYEDYIADNRYSANPIVNTNVAEAKRQLRELKWAWAVNLNTPEAYDEYIVYIDSIGDEYGRRDQARIEIDKYSSYVTAEVLRIEVDEAVSAFGEDNDLELFYNLEFTKTSNPLAGEPGWKSDYVISSPGARIMNINDGAETAVRPPGAANSVKFRYSEKAARYGGFMFEAVSEDSYPSVWLSPEAEADACEEFCQDLGIDNANAQVPSEYFFRTRSTSNSANPLHPVIDGLWDSGWAALRRLPEGSSPKGAVYAQIALAELPYQTPVQKTLEVRFSSTDIVRVTYQFTKRTKEQQEEFLTRTTIHCEDPPVLAHKMQTLEDVKAWAARDGIELELEDGKILSPGFLIRNETSQAYSVSLNQVGPLYYQTLYPGEIMYRDTASGHFTIDAQINLTGEDRYDDWDVAAPIVQFTAETLFSVFTGGTIVTSLKAAATASLKQAASAAAKSGASALSRNAFGRSLLKASQEASKRALAKIGSEGAKNAVIQIGNTAKGVAVDAAIDKAFMDELAKAVFTEDAVSESRSWRYAGPPFGFRTKIQMYHIVGGPRLPCLDGKGNTIEISSTKLQILPNNECNSSNGCQPAPW